MGYSVRFYMVHIRLHIWTVWITCTMVRQKFLNQWVTLNFDGTIRRGKIIDIEFTGMGPIFLLESKLGNKFWLSRQELRECEVRS